VGRYWMDPENTQRYPGHSLVNVSASVPITSRIELDARIDNLLDERFAENASYTAFRGAEYTPGLPRAFYLGVQYRWEGGDR
ncbi:MAG TPA: TonB-dependent receptor, partial [Longimicrobiales bacterium]|nr:TonB-dependent receptor [Longimicrobiales bacterium]